VFRNATGRSLRAGWEEEEELGRCRTREKKATQQMNGRLCRGGEVEIRNLQELASWRAPKHQPEIKISSVSIRVTGLLQINDAAFVASPSCQRLIILHGASSRAN
jgi:hypothetical protein